VHPRLLGRQRLGRHPGGLAVDPSVDRRAADRWPEIRPIIRIGRDAAAVDPELRDLVDRWLEESVW
jgi:hypothetical protein